MTDVRPLHDSLRNGASLGPRDDERSLERLTELFAGEKARVLFRIFWEGRVEELFTPEMPGVREVSDLFDRPERVVEAGFDARATRRAINRLAGFVPAPLVVRLREADAVLDPLRLLERGLLRRRDDDEPFPGTEDGAFRPPPEPFDDDFLEFAFQPFEQDCTDIRTVVPNVTVRRDMPGQVTGTAAAVQKAVELTAIADELFAIAEQGFFIPDDPESQALREQLREAYRQLRGEGFRPPETPADTSRERIAELAGQLRQKAEELRQLTFEVTGEDPDNLPRNLASVGGPGAVTIAAAAGTRVGMTVYSRMESTYTFGRGDGTHHSGPPGDLPWFAKISVPDGVGTLGPRVIQLGRDGERVTTDVESLIVPESGELSLPLAVNGNYGRARIVLTVEGKRCRLVDGTLVVKDFYEEDYLAREQQRFALVEAQRDVILDIITSATELIDLIVTILSVFPILGPLSSLPLKTAEKLIAAAGIVLRRKLDSANELQRLRNLKAAEKFPELGPVGGAEDNPLP